ncbi:MAG: hypothetical protein H6Q20_2205 [Bacteroidetes bacterium]|nr:hypothetical protein [Bacteroidota bacterium]
MATPWVKYQTNIFSGLKALNKIARKISKKRIVFELIRLYIALSGLILEFVITVPKASPRRGFAIGLSYIGLSARRGFTPPFLIF